MEVMRTRLWSSILHRAMHRPIHGRESRPAMLSRIFIQNRSEYITWVLRWRLRRRVRIHHRRVSTLLLVMEILVCREPHVMLRIWVWMMIRWYRTRGRVIHGSVVASRMVIKSRAGNKRLWGRRDGKVWRVMWWTAIGRRYRRD